MYIDVTLKEHSLAIRDPLLLYTQLVEHLGLDQVYLLENLRTRSQPTVSGQIGYGRLLLVSVHEHAIIIEGKPNIVSFLAQHVFAHGQLLNGRLTLCGKDAAPWKVLRETQRAFRVGSDPEQQHFRFGFFGYMGYESVHFVEELPWNGQATDDYPIMALGVYAHTIRFTAGSETAQHCVSSSAFWDSPAFELGVMLPFDHAQPLAEPPSPREIRFTSDENTYAEGVQKALHHIAVGDIYQVQLGHSISIRSDITPLEVYKRLRARCASPYMYLAFIGGRYLIGASPESFITVRDGVIAMRPLAGTAPRGKTTEEDQSLCEQLRSDPKEIAEHIMLVDLCRNDLSRICKSDSLAVEDLMTVEKHSHVMHLVSHVCAKPKDDVDVYDLIQATFPAGTMTGAPKIRAMEIIADIETTRRHAYAGAVGVMDFGGYAVLALCIRTAFFDGNEYTIRASAGVVADSDPCREWKETLHKMGSTYWAITGRELQ